MANVEYICAHARAHTYTHSRFLKVEGEPVKKERGLQPRKRISEATKKDKHCLSFRLDVDSRSNSLHTLIYVTLEAEGELLRERKGTRSWRTKKGNGVNISKV